MLGGVTIMGGINNTALRPGDVTEVDVPSIANGGLGVVNIAVVVGRPR